MNGHRNFFVEDYRARIRERLQAIGRDLNPVMVVPDDDLIEFSSATQLPTIVSRKVKSYDRMPFILEASRAMNEEGFTGRRVLKLTELEIRHTLQDTPLFVAHLAYNEPLMLCGIEIELDTGES